VSTVNAASRELSAKIVYYGPGLSGKTTSLKQVHATLRPERRGQLISLATEGDRTLFFDFLPVTVEEVRGLTLRLQLYTVPGQVFYDATRKLVLNGADGVVFVADSQPLARDSNLESMSNLETNLAESGIDLAGFPFVLQWNKRDLPGVVPLEELRRQLNPLGVPEFETVASRGEGILPALREITRLVVNDLKARQPRRAPTGKRLELGRGPPDATLVRDLAATVRAATVASSTPRPAPPVRSAAPAVPAPVRRDPGVQGLSFARMFPGQGGAVAEVELAIRERAFAAAVRTAARGVAEVLATLPASEGVNARAALLGLDGKEFLRLGRLAERPDDAVTEIDALFGLYLLVSAMVKVERI
jgi:mutual gliding-motility protein MglA